jgi:hypothetical protein
MRAWGLETQSVALSAEGHMMQVRLQHTRVDSLQTTRQQKHNLCLFLSALYAHLAAYQLMKLHLINDAAHDMIVQAPQQWSQRDVGPPAAARCNILLRFGIECLGFWPSICSQMQHSTTVQGS